MVLLEESVNRNRWILDAESERERKKEERIESVSKVAKDEIERERRMV